MVLKWVFLLVYWSHIAASEDKSPLNSSTKNQRIHLMDISMICHNFTSSTDITICSQEKEISSNILHGFPLEPVILLKDEFDARKIHGIIRELFDSLIGAHFQGEFNLSCNAECVHARGHKVCSCFNSSLDKNEDTSLANHNSTPDSSTSGVYLIFLESGGDSNRPSTGATLEPRNSPRRRPRSSCGCGLGGMFSTLFGSRSRRRLTNSQRGQFVSHGSRSAGSRRSENNPPPPLPLPRRNPHQQWVGTGGPGVESPDAVVGTRFSTPGVSPSQLSP